MTCIWPHETVALKDMDLAVWSDEIAARFFPITVIATTADRFVAQLQTWRFERTQVVCSRSSSARYLRPDAIRNDDNQHILVTFCVDLTIRLHDGACERFCRPGQFIVHPTNNRWNWDQETEGEMWSLRLPMAPLKRRLGDLGKFEPHAYDLTRGTGRVLLGITRLVSSYAGEDSASRLQELQAILIDILAMALEEDRQTLAAGASFTQRGHLSRIERHIRANLENPRLNPAMIAAACNISTRYLHDLFSASGTSVSRWILEQRLQGACRSLAAGGRRQNISQVAFQWGFSDHAHFSRHFKSRFGVPPREAAARLGDLVR